VDDCGGRGEDDDDFTLAPLLLSSTPVDDTIPDDILPLEEDAIEAEVEEDNDDDDSDNGAVDEAIAELL